MLVAALILAATTSAFAASFSNEALVHRQLNNQVIADSCRSQCEKPLPLLEHCSGDRDKAICFKLCEQDHFNEGISCLQCNIDAGVVSKSQVQAIKEQIAKWKDSCSFAAGPVTGDVHGAGETPSSTIRAAVTEASSTASSASSTSSGNGSSKSKSGAAALYNDAWLSAGAVVMVGVATVFW
ncbi:hypothetical protein L204_105596 [Cryptococcus depauperatus]|nr:hypothetical protein L204_02637 [Cryptococcus depauperatus CBS 7855]